MNQLILFWVMVFLGLILLETLSPGFFFFISLSAGALAGLGMTMLGFPFSMQVLAFLVTSIIVLIILRLLVRYAPFFRSRPEQETNFYALLGKQAVVVAPLTPFKKGYVRIDGELWGATTQVPETLTSGTVVEVLAVSGSHLVVKKTLRVIIHKDTSS